MYPRGPGKGTWLWVFVRSPRAEVVTSLVALGSVAFSCLGLEPVFLDRIGLSLSSSPTLLPSPILGDQEPEEHTSWSAGLGTAVAVTLWNPWVGIAVAAEWVTQVTHYPGEHGDPLRPFLVHCCASSKVSVVPYLFLLWTWPWSSLLCAGTARMLCRREVRL